ncbi:MAG: flagellar basal body L-ring protein FlgH [Pseudohongiellaceae bacterium]|jgi:flagellar L-ring protein FlgH
MRQLLMLVILFTLCACASAPAEDIKTSFALTYPESRGATRVSTGSIYDNGVGLYPTRRIYMAGEVKVGDILTIILNETAQASRSSGLTAERATENSLLGLEQAGALFPEGAFFDFGEDGLTETGISSTGTGSADQSATLRGSLSAVVIDIMDNGNLVILGQKRLTMTEGSEVIEVKGVIRPEDIQPNNTVLSRRIANAEISYSGSGDLARAVRPSWGTRVFMGLWPF